MQQSQQEQDQLLNKHLDSEEEETLVSENNVIFDQSHQGMPSQMLRPTGLGQVQYKHTRLQDLVMSNDDDDYGQEDSDS